MAGVNLPGKVAGDIPGLPRHVWTAKALFAADLAYASIFNMTPPRHGDADLFGRPEQALDGRIHDAPRVLGVLRQFRHGRGGRHVLAILDMMAALPDP